MLARYENKKSKKLFQVTVLVLGVISIFHTGKGLFDRDTLAWHWYPNKDENSGIFLELALLSAFGIQESV